MKRKIICHICSSGINEMGKTLYLKEPQERFVLSLRRDQFDVHNMFSARKSFRARPNRNDFTKGKREEWSDSTFYPLLIGLENTGIEVWQSNIYEVMFRKERKKKDDKLVYVNDQYQAKPE